MLKAAMKLWLKYLAGILLGGALALALPPSFSSRPDLVFLAADIATRVGGYALMLLFVTNVAASVFHASEAHTFWKTAGRTILLDLLALVAATALGMAASRLAQAFPLSLPTDQNMLQVPDPQSLLRDIFPNSIFSVFVKSESMLLPVLLFTFAMGMALAHDPVMARPIVPLLDVLAKASSFLNAFIAEILGIVLIPLVLASVLRMRTVIITPGSGAFLWMLALATLLMLGLVLALAYRMLGGRTNPYVLLYAMAAPLAAALVSGDLRFAAGSAFHHAKEDGITEERTAGIVFPLHFLMGRIGTAFVTGAAVVSMFHSYSRAGMTATEIAFMLALVPCAVLLASATFPSTPMLALGLVCIMLGKGFETGAMFLLPLAFPMSLAATVLDVAWSIYAAALASERIQGSVPRKMRTFI